MTTTSQLDPPLSSVTISLYSVFFAALKSNWYLFFVVYPPSPTRLLTEIRKCWSLEILYSRAHSLQPSSQGVLKTSPWKMWITDCHPNYVWPACWWQGQWVNTHFSMTASIVENVAQQDLTSTLVCDRTKQQTKTQSKDQYFLNWSWV